VINHGLSSLHTANLSWRTCVGKLKLTRVNSTKTVGKRVGKLLGTNRPCLYSRQRFLVGKLVSDVWTIGKHVLLTVNQSKHRLCSRDLFAWHVTKWWTQFKISMRPLLNLSKRFRHVMFMNLYEVKLHACFSRESLLFKWINRVCRRMIWLIIAVMHTT